MMKAVYIYIKTRNFDGTPTTFTQHLTDCQNQPKAWQVSPYGHAVWQYSHCRQPQLRRSAYSSAEENHKKATKNLGPKNIANFSSRLTTASGLNMTSPLWAHV